MSKRKLRVGVVGLGMGKGHAEMFRACELCELAALADIDEQRLRSVGEELAVKDLYGDPEEMFAKAQLDAVSIAVPNKFHCSLTLAALERGLHVLCEKPMAMNVAEAESMKAAAEAAGRVLMINLSYRFDAVAQALKRQVDGGAAGPIYFGRTVWHRRRGMPGFGGWFGNKEMAGGGPLIDLGVHRIDLAMWLMGHPEPMSVSGSIYDVIGQAEALRQNKTFTTEDLACGIVKFKNGASLLVESSWALNINEDERMITELYGSKGSVVHRNVNGTYEFTGEICTAEDGFFYRKTLECVRAEVPSAYVEFVRSIVEQSKPPATADDGIRVQKILDGMYESAATGREVVFG